MKKIIFLLFFIFINFNGQAETLLEFNKAFSEKTQTLSDLTNSKNVLLKRAKDEMVLLLARKKAVVPDNELNAYATILHNLTILNYFSNNILKSEVNSLWDNFAIVALRSNPEYKQVIVQNLRLTLRTELSPEKFAEFLKGYRNSIPIKYWKLNAALFLIRPCERYNEIGMVLESISCYENLQEYFVIFEPNRKEEIENIIRALTTIYFRINDSKRLLALSRTSSVKNLDFDRQYMLLLFDRIEKDYKSSQIRIEYLRNLALKNNLKLNSIMLMSDVFITKYLQNPQAKNLIEFVKWYDANAATLSSNVKNRITHYLAALEALSLDWPAAYKHLKSIYNFSDSSLLVVNTLYCLSSYYVSKSNTEECSKYGKKMDSELASTNLHWSVAKSRYLFQILAKKLSLKERKEIRNYLQNAEVKRAKETDAVLIAISNLYLTAQ